MKPKNKLLTIIIFVCMIIFTGCNEDKTNASRALRLPFDHQLLTELVAKEDLPEWLIEKIEQSSGQSVYEAQVYKGLWQGETVYCISNIWSSVFFYDCFLSDGTIIVWSENNTHDDFVKTSSNWKCIYVFFI